MCGSPSAGFLISEEMCGCAAHYFTKCAGEVKIFAWAAEAAQAVDSLYVQSNGI
jgi:hypothetical protein